VSAGVSTRTRLALAVALGLVAAGLATPTAQAAGDSPSAVAAMRSLDRLAAIRARTTARLDLARGRLRAVRAQAGIASAQLEVDRSNLAASRAMLAQVLVGEYKSGGSEDSAVFVFAADSFGDLINRIDAADRIGIAETNGIHDVTAESSRVADDLNALTTREQEVAEQVAQLTAARDRIDRTIAARQALLASLTRRTRTAVSTEDHRRSQLVRQDSGGSSSTGGNVFTGAVTWYGPGFAGHRTADGEIFDPSKLTAASPWLPFNTILDVTSTVTGRSVEVRVNDRGPYGSGVLDLSAHAAQVIGLEGWQICHIRIVSEP
jgi:rare lipoprotein A